MEGAERQYRRALELDANHVNALGNLANLRWEKGDQGKAADLYRQALEADPGNENVTLNYARFLHAQRDDRREARRLLDLAIARHPESGRLFLLRGQLSFPDGNPTEALENFLRAREKGADQAPAEAGYAYALHLGGAPIGECIAGYHVAIGLNPREPTLRLNLAQLLFVKGEDGEAHRQLREATKLGLEASAELEAQFYLLAHGRSDPTGIIARIQSLLSQGARLTWNVGPTIDAVRGEDPDRATFLQLVAQAMEGKRDRATLDQIAAHLAAISPESIGRDARPTH